MCPIQVLEYDKASLNAFPKLQGAYVPTEDYELPFGDGDETPESHVVHFAGQFGGARNSDGVTPPTMLVQFLDVLLVRHQAFLLARDGVARGGDVRTVSPWEESHREPRITLREPRTNDPPRDSRDGRETSREER